MRYSIVVPLALDRSAPVKQSIAELNYPNDNYEVLIERGVNPSLNRNLAIKKSQGDILAFVDDDAFVKSDWLGKADSFFEKYPDIDIVGGPQMTSPDDGFFARHSGYVFASVFGAGKMSSRYRLGKTNLEADELNLTSCNMFVKRSVFEAISNFEPQLFPNEETEFLQRAVNYGLKIAYSPELIVYHKRRDTFFAFLKQCFRVGKGRARQDVLMKLKLSVWVAIPIMFLFYVALVPLLYYLSTVAIVPTAIYLILSLGSALYCSIRNSDGLIFFTYPLLTFSLHLIYPSGYLYERFRLAMER
jgi:GT2 family glycosyltransferase